METRLISFSETRHYHLVHGRCLTHANTEACPRACLSFLHQPGPCCLPLNLLPRASLHCLAPHNTGLQEPETWWGLCGQEGPQGRQTAYARLALEITWWLLNSVPICEEYLVGQAGATDIVDRETWPAELATCWEGNADTFGAISGQERMTLTLHLLLFHPCPSGDLAGGTMFRSQVLWEVRAKDKIWMDREGFVEDCPRV